MSKQSLNDYVSGFKLEGKMSMAERVALFLLGASKVAPKQPIPKNLIAKAVFGLSKTPPKDGDKVDVISSTLARSREILRERFGVTLDVERGRGARATVDHDDHVNTRVKQTARGLVSKHKALVAEASIVDADKIKNETNKKWFKSQVLTTTKLLSAEERILKLLPPKEDDDDKEKK
jgi:hypothetical protein